MNLRERLEALNPGITGPRHQRRPVRPVMNEEVFPVEHTHGNGNLGMWIPWLLKELGTLGKDPEPSKIAFLDTETTGLSGGVGTHVFMVGLGQITGSGFQVRQYVLRDPGTEHEFLESINQDLCGFDTLVSFNGKAFDIPQMKTRFLYHRIPVNLPRDNLDLLYPARRLWKESLPCCDLGTLEREVLGIKRHGDIPGYLIPSMYFRYLFGHDPDALEPIMLHNRMDVLSLLVLGGTISRIMDTGPDGGSDPSHLYSLGRALLKRGDPRGIDWLEIALNAGLPPSLEQRARLLLASTYKKSGKGDSAKRHLMNVCSNEGPVEAYIELAKHLEHREKDPAAALGVVSAVLERRHVNDRLRQELEHRWQRLQRKASGERSAQSGFSL